MNIKIKGNYSPRHSFVGRYLIKTPYFFILLYIEKIPTYAGMTSVLHERIAQQSRKTTAHRCIVSSGFCRLSFVVLEAI